MILDKQKKIVVLPETLGGSSIKLVHKEYERGAIPCHADAKSLLRGNDGYELGAFVRNPYTKAIALFHWRHNGNGVGPKGSNGELAEDFEKWILTTFHQECSCFDRIQVDGKIELDFLGKFETLGKDFKRLCDWTGIKGLELPDRHRGLYKYDPEEYFTDKVVETIKTKWDKTFSEFGYSEDYRDIEFRNWNKKD